MKWIEHAKVQIEKVRKPKTQPSMKGQSKNKYVEDSVEIKHKLLTKGK